MLLLRSLEEELNAALDMRVLGIVAKGKMQLDVKKYVTTNKMVIFLLNATCTKEKVHNFRLKFSLSYKMFVQDNFKILISGAQTVKLRSNLSVSGGGRGNNQLLTAVIFALTGSVCRLVGSLQRGDR